MVRIHLAREHIPYEIVEYVLFNRVCVNDCCGWEVGIFVAVVVVFSAGSLHSSQKGGVMVCFWLLDGGGRGMGSAKGSRRSGAHLLLIAPLLYLVDLFQHWVAQR